MSVAGAIDRLLRGLELALGLLLIGMVLLNFLNVALRYGFGESLLGAEEIQVYAMVWMTFLGAAIVTWRNAHLRMDAISVRFHPRVRAALAWAEAALALVVVGYVLRQSWLFVGRVMRLEQLSDVAHVPMWIPHSAVVVGLALVTLLLVVRAARLRGGADREA
ncbi:MAG TPA: TRAP transporter small permease [Beijerinckiaceae bacterium]|jgi:TRAP-type C4-dicarboxylate transport system permease small subunit